MSAKKKAKKHEKSPQTKKNKDEVEKSEDTKKEDKKEDSEKEVKHEEHETTKVTVKTESKGNDDILEGTFEWGMFRLKKGQFKMTPDVLLSMNKNYITITSDLTFKAWKNKGDDVPYREYSLKLSSIEMQRQQIHVDKFLVFKMPKEYSNDIWLLMKEEVAEEWEDTLSALLMKSKSPTKKNRGNRSSENIPDWSKELFQKLDTLGGKIDEVSSKVDKVHTKLEQVEKEVEKLKVIN